jgi:hypothetical protein
MEQQTVQPSDHYICGFKLLFFFIKKGHNVKESGSASFCRIRKASGVTIPIRILFCSNMKNSEQKVSKEVLVKHCLNTKL